ncbi:MAG: hypothetical protein IIW45_02270 [Alistipes sp.]|nr:hypothetical protein [Alistipes sp.]
MALIRCKKCGNPASSRSKACPICGEPIAQEVALENTTTAASAPQSTPQPTTSTPSESAPKTLNDILAEGRTSQPQTLNERLAASQESTEKVQPSTEEATAAEAEPTPIIPPVVQYDYPAEDFNIDDVEEELRRRDRSVKGYKTAVIILALLLIPLTFFVVRYAGKVKTVEEDYALVESARKIFEEQNSLLQRDAESLVSELESLKDKNDTMMVKYQEAVTMLEQLQKEKTYNYEQLARYKREVATLKGVMKGYLQQIDSLNNINRNLQAQNVEYKREITDAQLRADVAEEKADELNTKVRIGAVIRSSGIRMSALNSNSREVRRIKQATRLRVDFELTANELAEPGEKSIYICITNPEGFTLLSPEMTVFMFEGEEMVASAMRKVDYENESVPVSIYYDGSAFVKGTYKVDIYIDGRHSGSQETYFE